MCQGQTALVRVSTCRPKIDDLGRSWVQKSPNWVQKVSQLGLIWVHRTSHDVWSDSGSGCWAFLTVFEVVFEGVFERGVEGEGFRRGLRRGRVLRVGFQRGEGFRCGFRERRFRAVQGGFRGSVVQRFYCPI